MSHALIAGPAAKVNLARADELGKPRRLCVGVAALVRGIIKGANHRQTDELCALSSQTNKGAVFERSVQETEECLRESAGNASESDDEAFFFFFSPK